MQGTNEFAAIVRPLRIEMETLSAGVDTRIGAATAMR